MPRTCTACSHERPNDIDRLLLEGASLRNIAKRFSLSAANLFRHNKHLSATLAKSHEEAEIIRELGEYFVLEVNRNCIVEKDVDLEPLARERSVLGKLETLRRG